MHEPTDMERLAVAQALYNVVGAHVSTKTEGNLRNRVDEAYRAKFEEDGAKSFAVRINGEQVGTYSVRTSSKKDAEEKAVIDLVDDEAFDGWIAIEAERELLADFALSEAKAFAEHCLEMGVVPPGTKARTETRAADPGGEYLGGTLKVDPEKVAEAMGEYLPGAVAGLLGGGAQ